MLTDGLGNPTMLEFLNGDGFDGKAMQLNVRPVDTTLWCYLPHTFSMVVSSSTKLPTTLSAVIRALVLLPTHVP